MAIARLLLSQEQFDDDEWKSVLNEVSQIERTDLGSVAWLRAERILREMNDASNRREQLATAKMLLKSAERTRPYWSAIPRALGLLEELQGQREAAIEAYERALLLGDRSPEVIRRVVLYYYSRQQFSEADRLLQQMANENANLLTGDLARLAWRVSWNRQQYDEALGVVRRLAESSQSAEDYIDLAFIQFAQGGARVEVEQSLRKAAYELSPDSAETWSALVAYYARTQQWTAAESAVADARDRLVVAEPSTKHLLIGNLFEILASAGAPRQRDYAADATRAYERAIGEAGDDNTVLTVVADYFVRNGSEERARPLLQTLLDPARKVPPEVRVWARRRLAQVVASGGSYDDTRRALDLLRSVVANGEDRSPANLRLQLQLLNRVRGQDTRTERVELLNALQVQASLTPDEHLQLAELLQSSGEAVSAQHEYRSLLEVFPKLTRARAGLILSLLGNFTSDEAARQEARKQVQFLKDQEPDSWQTALVRVRLLTLSGEAEQAVSILDEFLQRRLAEGAENPVREILDQENLPFFVSELQGDIRVRNVPAQLAAVTEVTRLLQSGQREEAIQFLLKGAVAPLLAELRYDVILKAGLLCEELRLGDPERYFREYAAKSPRSEARLELASFLVRQSRLDEALSLCEAVWKDGSAAGVAIVLLKAARRLPADQRQILAPWRDRLAVAASADNVAHRWLITSMLGELEGLLGSEDASIAAYRRGVAENPRDSIAWNNLAYLLARRNASPEDLQEAERAINESLRLTSPNESAVDTQAVVFLAQGRAAEAVAALQPFLASPASAEILFRHAECLWRLGKLSDARRELQMARRKGWRIEELQGSDRLAAEACVQAVDANR